MIRYASAAMVAALLCAGTPARAQFPDNTIKIGVLTDLSGPFSDQVGQGSVTAAKLAAEDFEATNPGIKVEILAADHLNKPDVGVGIARAWVDNDHVAAIVDLPNSGVALAVANLLREKNRVALASNAATSDLTGSACSANVVQWTMDTWAQGQSTAAAMTARKLDTWFFLTVDYALGQALERDATRALVADGGKVLGAVRSPLGTADFSGPLLQAQSSGAKVIVLANTGADAINAVKQAAEFGVGANGTQIAALFLQLSDVHSLGLQAAQGLQLTSGFYWDMNDDTRAFAKRFAARMNGRMPTEDHAGTYAATLHYLRAMKVTPTMDGATAVAAMKALPVDDKLFGTTSVRADGRAIHPMHVFQVKKPADSKYPYDYYTMVQTTPGDQAFRPLADGHCAMVN
jgi:branched-chain amino acid transport system substrate-binding protein